MFDVGGGELLFILLIILLLFGPKKIPELMRSVGTGLSHFRRAQEDLTKQIRDLSTQDPTATSTPVRTVIDDGAAPNVTPTPAAGVEPRPPQIHPPDDSNAQ
jgi:sec-independent protein translocase protein TatA